jgi:hypothetical protein
MIAAMLVTPLLQSNQVQAFAVRQSAKQADFERQQVTQQQLDDLRTELSGRGFNPTLNPLTDTDQQAEATIPSFQSNGEISCSDTLDSDGDGLIDAVECYKLDTLSDAVDSDADGISDITEVEGFTAGGRQWYLDPLNRDSNNDGLPDAVECPTLADVDENGNLSNPLGSSCVDTDGDSTPDVFDFDNDGDGVPDRLDASPNYTDDLSAELHSQLKLNLSGYDGTERSLVVDFQLRPSDLSHLFQTNNVLDWPSNDTQGQLARVNDNTLADLGYVGDKTANGDMLLAPMLEIKIPAPTEDSANPSGGLPVQADFSGVIATSPLTAWLDIDLLAEYSISVNQDGEGAPIYAYLPLSVIEDPTGNTPVAWGTQMLYQPGDTDWGDAHEMRLLWLVQMINDTCDTSGMGEDDDYETWCKPDGPNWSSNLTIAQTYYEDFYLSGLTVREDYGMDIAVLAQDNALSVDYENYLWHLSNGLQKAFGEGQLIDDNNDGTGDRRFDFTELVSRFEGSSGTVWDIPVSRIAVNSASYPDQVSGLGGMVRDQIPDTLSSLYSGATSGDAVTLLIAREESYKTTSLEEDAAYDSRTSTLEISLDDVTEQTYATLNWSPYEYDASGEWLSMNLFDYTEQLEANLANAISNNEVRELLRWFGETARNIDILKEGIIGQARDYYIGLYLSTSGLVYDSDFGNINREVVDDSAFTLDFDGDNQPDEAALVIVATSVGLMQFYFVREGTLILDEVYEILLTMGAIEESLDNNNSEPNVWSQYITSGLASASAELKRMIKKQVKVEGAAYYYPQKKTVATANYYTILSAGTLALINAQFFGSKNQALTITSETLFLGSAAVSAAMEFIRFTGSHRALAMTL